MSLAASDLHAIRAIVREEISAQVEPLTGRIEALENDVKDIYFMISDMQQDLGAVKNLVGA